MKKLLLLTVAILSICFAQAQEHMSFKGVSMGCNISTFVSKLKSLGYVEKAREGDLVVLSGDFAGKDDCEIYVMSTSASKQVWKVGVFFPKQVSWDSLKGEYKNFKESYTEKYGEPKSYEFFKDPYYEGDGYELQALRLEKCRYVSFFDTPVGGIILEIGSTESVLVQYEDAINVSIKNEEAQNIISNDI